MWRISSQQTTLPRHILFLHPQSQLISLTPNKCHLLQWKKTTQIKWDRIVVSSRLIVTHYLTFKKSWSDPSKWKILLHYKSATGDVNSNCFEHCGPEMVGKRHLRRSKGWMWPEHSGIFVCIGIEIMNMDGRWMGHEVRTRSTKSERSTSYNTTPNQSHDKTQQLHIQKHCKLIVDMNCFAKF